MVDTDSGKPGKIREKISLWKTQGKMVLLWKNENFAFDMPELPKIVPNKLDF